MFTAGLQETSAVYKSARDAEGEKGERHIAAADTAAFLLRLMAALKCPAYQRQSCFSSL